jgi:hypothetical protein
MLNKKMIIFLAVASAFLLSQAYVGGGKATGRPDPPEVFKVTDYLTGLKACITLAFAPLRTGASSLSPGPCSK